ncbi:MAG: transposase, partial [Flavobacteriales bacterium]
SSTNFVNRKGLTSGKFAWQTGYGGFAHSRSEIGKVATYIEKQKEHHQKLSFKEEYLKLLNRYHVPYKEDHLFEWIE